MYGRAVDARDPRFDGVFFVAITTTRVYCRPVCPSRLARNDHRRFFDSAAAAERAGYPPCLRCRPELAPGRAGHALVDVVSRLAHAAVQRIAAGALNGHTVADLARDLEVSERHLRRALERETGVTPLELAQTQRLLLAKRLLVDTALPVTRVAYGSGFQSLRRFNTVFREQYGLPPSALRRRAKASSGDAATLRLTLAYRPPFAWDALVAMLRRDAAPGVERVVERCYERTVKIAGHAGVVTAEDGPGHVAVAVSASLLPVLMPLIAGLRHLFDLDADSAAVDAHLSRHGLGPLVAQRRGVRIPGALSGFEVALRALLGRAQARRVTVSLGEPIVTSVPGLTHVAPTAERIADAGDSWLAALGIPRQRAERVAALARAIADGSLRLEPGGDVELTCRALREIGTSDRVATVIAMRALYWPDAFPAGDRALQRAAGVSGEGALRTRAEQWRPWRAYAALHLWLAGD